MAWLALWWKVVGYAPVVTRTAMLVLAAFSLLGVFRLAERVANTNVAIASTLCTALVSRLLCAKLARARGPGRRGAYLLGAFGLRGRASGRNCSLVHPRSFGEGNRDSGPCGACWLGDPGFGRDARVPAESMAGLERVASPSPVLRTKDPRAHRRVLLVPALPLALWYVYHYARTGYVFGNPEFFRYNVAATLSPTRFLLALIMRLWQVVGYLHLWVLTLAMLLAMWMLPPLRDAGSRAPANQLFGADDFLRDRDLHIWWRWR